MSEKQVLKAEELLEMVSSPGQRSQLETYAQTITGEALIEHSSSGVSSDHSVSIASHEEDTQTVTADLDIIACHAFLTETITKSDESANENVTRLSKSVTDCCFTEPSNEGDSEIGKTICLDLDLDKNNDSIEEDTNIKIEQLGKKQEVDSEMDIQFSESDQDLVISEQNKNIHLESIGHIPAKSEQQVINETFVRETKVPQKVGQCKIPDAVENLETDSSDPKTGIHLSHNLSTQKEMDEKMMIPAPCYEELQQELRVCKEELLSTKSQLCRAQRQLEKANDYNEDLRKQVESLSSEIHHYRHRTVKEVGIEVDKDELMNYAAGQMVLPDWGITVQSSDKTAEAVTQKLTTDLLCLNQRKGEKVFKDQRNNFIINLQEKMLLTPAGIKPAISRLDKATGDKLSIAESLKATAEAVVLEQSGFVYDENYGLYYDYNSGYYYDNEKSLYYEPNTGTYFYYNHETNEYQFHSQVDVSCYQWQHQSGAPNSQHTETTTTAQQKENQTNSKQKDILSKEKLRKTERKRKKEHKKDKDKDNNVYKNRKERRKALMDRIEKKRKKKEKKEKKKHHRKKKRKTVKKVKSEKKDTDKYVENKMRKRIKKKRHKRDQETDACEFNEVIEIEEDKHSFLESEKGKTHSVKTNDKVMSSKEEGKLSLNSRINELGTASNKSTIDSEHTSNPKAEQTINIDETGLGQTLSVICIDSVDDYLAKPASQEEEDMECDTCGTENGSEPILLAEHVVEKGLETLGDALKVDTGHIADPKALGKNASLNQNSKLMEDVNVISNLLQFKTEEESAFKGDMIPVPSKEETSVLKTEQENDVIKLEVDVSETREFEIENIEVTNAVENNSITISSESDSEMESGEISASEISESESDSYSSYSSDSSLDSDVSSSANEEDNQAQEHELAGGWPPCIRVIVTESNCLDVGTLFIITCTGGTVGREKDMNHAIRIPDINVSKMHAEIQFDSKRGQYEILDRGSQNGTFVNDQRIAEAKEQSSATPLTHGNVIQLADTKLLCHIHVGSDTCDNCEPGIVIANHLAKQPQKRITILSKEEKQKQHRKQLQDIKKKYGLKNAAYVDNMGAITNPLYTDKASERRKTVGSDMPGTVGQGTPASVHRPISSGNVGHKLLKKMGWSEGESLGKGNTGIQEPVSVILRAYQTAGLGSSAAGVFSPDEANSIDVKKAARRVQAQQRFNKLPTEPTENKSDKSQSNKQWTKGATQFFDGGIG